MRNKTWGVRLTPLKEIHLNPQTGYEAEQKGNRSILIALIFAAISILLIAWINYVNLTVAQSMERAKEVGIRRMAGAFPRQLIGQFLFEALLMNLIALILAAGLVEAVLPAFNNLVGRTVSFRIWFTGYWGIGVALLLAAGICLSGYYPARILLRYRPIVLLKGKFLNNRRGNRIRELLVVVQYAASMILLCGTLVVFAQLSFMRSRPLGVNTERILAVKYPAPSEGMPQKIEALRKALKQIPSVDRVTSSGAVPGEEVATFLSNHRTRDALKQNRLYEMLSCDADYIDTYGLEVLAGRGFSESYGNDVDKLVVNESAVRTLGFATNDEALGEEITVEGAESPMQIIGVIKDYHQQSLNKDYTPIMLIHKDKIDWLPQRYLSIRFHPADPAAIVAETEKRWKEYFADSSFDSFFLDRYYDRQYKSDKAFGIIMVVFAGLAIFVSCLGLWGLAVFSCAIRTKEMGIRKVLGASHGRLFRQLGETFLFPILTAVCIGFPVAWFGMEAWLGHYAFRTEMKPWFFLLPIGLLLLISFVTVFRQVVKVVTGKPARSLKYE